MVNTELGNFCKLHNNWRELLVEEPYYLKIKEDGDYVIFNYDQIKSDFSLDIVREARGIIFRKDHWRNPVCWAFNKFFNYGESHADQINWSTAFVTEKVDGSIIKVWHDKEWHISTNSMINAADAKLPDIRINDFKDYFYLALRKYYDSTEKFFKLLNPDLTYIFELVGPCNRVVVEYDQPALYFLGARDKFTGGLYQCSVGNLRALGLTDLDVPHVYPLTSLEDCVKLADTFSWDQEGFVVCDAFENRVKIKSPAYVMAHFARNNNVITRKHLIEVILRNETEEFLCYAADYKEQLDKCTSLMNTYHKLGDMFAAAGRKASIMTRKDYAEMVKTFPVIFQGLMFINYDKDCYAKEYTIDWTAEKWDRYLTAMEELKYEYFDKE